MANIIEFSERALLNCVMKHLVECCCTSITLDKLVNFYSSQSDDKLCFVNSVTARQAMTITIADSERGHLICIFQLLVSQNMMRSHGSIQESLIFDILSCGENRRTTVGCMVKLMRRSESGPSN